ncbi:MAG: 3-deoxy-manno-octulosonate cytidylyltransferase [Coxiellaceae bacterium]|nr:3-deoxy-manno-octulosonate cytidylyltransferase [Coxiellaceae bacterium]
MKVVIGIPARMGSTRYPGKPLVDILGMPMLEHVYKRSLLAKHIDDVFVAACDEEIKSVVTGFGGNVYMTPKEISRPALRVAEACKQLSLDDDDIVVVVQGDEPLVHPGMLDLAVKPLLEDKSVQLLTLVAEATEKEWLDINAVKVVTDKNEDVLFMSRSPIPSNTRNRPGKCLKQVAIMPFRKKFLLEFLAMEAMPYEITESVELLRAVEHGVKVRTALSPFQSASVDTKEDQAKVIELMKKDVFFPEYTKINTEVSV